MIQAFPVRGETRGEVIQKRKKWTHPLKLLGKGRAWRRQCIKTMQEGRHRKHPWGHIGCQAGQHRAAIQYHRRSISVAQASRDIQTGQTDHQRKLAFNCILGWWMTGWRDIDLSRSKTFTFFRPVCLLSPWHSNFSDRPTSLVSGMEISFFDNNFFARPKFYFKFDALYRVGTLFQRRLVGEIRGAEG